MERKGLRAGHFIALVGALLALGSLWRPWFAVDLPPQVRDAFGAGGALGGDPGLLGQLARGIADALPSSVTLTGWRFLDHGDVVVCAGALAVLALVLGAAGALGPVVRIDPSGAGGAVALLGAAVLAIPVVHLISRPGGAEMADWVHAADGLWIAVAGGAAMLLGGLSAAQRPTAERTAFGTVGGGAAAGPSGFARLDPELPPVFATPAPGGRSSSVPPPGGR